mgnify:CR=1 FL=1|jgi:hypothetical protein
MRENQELRDKIEFLENGDIHPRNAKSRSRSPNMTPNLNNRRRSSKYERQNTVSGAYGTSEEQPRKDRENLMYTTMSTLHPDHEPVKGIVSPTAEYGSDKMGFPMPQKRPTTNDSNSLGAPNDIENHFRTTTNFARNTIYRKFHLTNANLMLNGPDSNGYENNYTTDAYNSREMGMDISNIGKTNSTPSHSRARNKSDYSSYGVDESYQNSKLLRPKRELDRSYQGGKGSMERSQYSQRPPSNIKINHPQNSKILLLKDVTHNITPIIQHPRSHGSKLNRGLNNSFL